MYHEEETIEPLMKVHAGLRGEVRVERGNKETLRKIEASPHNLCYTEAVI